MSCPVVSPAFPEAIAITPNGATAYVLNSDSVTPISTRTNKAGPPITVGYDPKAIAITPRKSLPVPPAHAAAAQARFRWPPANGRQHG
ncbi:MAG TPA: hypothetical protein VHZ03_35865 [Trebonia sp.]|jgi:DNA-binding beta-propeller fold protein YncE|nr:hypothetical protein [Trebonia sp.]